MQDDSNITTMATKMRSSISLFASPTPATQCQASNPATNAQIATTSSVGSGNTSPGANVIAITNLPAGGSSGNHFGERLGSVAGSVFLDTDNNGARNGADTGIAGVTLTLTGTDVSGNPVNRSTTTDASGNYRFDDLLAAGAGGYTLTEQAAQPVVGGTATLNGRTTAGTVAAGHSLHRRSATQGSARSGLPGVRWLP